MIKAVTAEREQIYRAHEDVLAPVAELMDQMDAVCMKLAESLETADLAKGDPRAELIVALVETISASNSQIDNAVHQHAQRSLMRSRAEKRRTRSKLLLPPTTNNGGKLARVH